MRSFKTSNGKIVPADDMSENVWVRLTQPTIDEISLVAKTLNIDVTDVSASLDKEEGSRFEILDNGVLLLVDIPYENSSNGTSAYDTMPLAIISSSKAVVTVCQVESSIIGKFSDGSVCNVTLNGTEFILKILYGISLEYQQCLRKIRTRCKEIETKINRSTENADIIELHQLELSSVYFITSLRACNVVLDKMNRYMEKGNDKTNLDLLHDVIIENEQAIEMATIYREVIDSARELFVGVMNNKLNSVMKWLTSITVILSIPMILSGIYGMNVGLPLMYDKFAFIYIMILLITVCTIGVFVLKRKKLL